MGLLDFHFVCMFTFYLTFHVIMLSSLSPGPSPGPGQINVNSKRNPSKEGLILIFDKNAFLDQ